MVKSAIRTLEILEAVAAVPNGLAHAEIAKALRIPKSSLTNLLRSLAARRYLTLEEATGIFTIGPSVLPLSRAFLDRYDIVKMIAPVTARLRDAVGEAVILATLDDTHIVVVHHEPSRQPLSAIMRVGDRAPALLTAAGKALFAFLPEDQIERQLEALPGSTNAPIRLSADMLRQQLEAVRSGGLAISREEYAQGIVALGLPIFGEDVSVPAAAMTVNLPTARVSDRKMRSIEQQLRSAVAEASHLLGGRVPGAISAGLHQIDVA